MSRHRTIALTEKGEAAVKQIRRGRQLTAADLTECHFGRTVDVANMTGTLVGLIPVAQQVTLALIVGGAHVWLPVDADTQVQVHGKAAA